METRYNVVVGNGEGISPFYDRPLSAWGALMVANSRKEVRKTVLAVGTSVVMGTIKFGEARLFVSFAQKLFNLLPSEK